MKPEVIYTLPDAIKQIAVLQQAQTTLGDTLTQERQVFSRIIQELTLQNEQSKQENDKLNRQLFAANEISLDKDRLITSLQQELSRMREQMEEGLRKGWQLQELQQMLFGKRSERYS